MVDHPLCRLFGECQYSVLQYIQIIMRDIEMIHDIPKLTITPDHSHATGKLILYYKVNNSVFSFNTF